MRSVQLCYERRGVGPPLVLLHGIGHRWQSWLPVLDLLAESRDVIAIDLPGFGGTPLLPGRPFGLESLEETFADLCALLEVERPHVAGNSLGGLLALELADRGLVRSATALAPAGFWSAAGRGYALAVLALHRGAGRLPTPVLTAVGRSRALRAAATGLMFARPHRLEWDTVLADLAGFRAAPGFWPTARTGRRYRYTGRPRVPVTIAWGAKDRILPVWQARRARRLLPDARHVVLPGCGHVPMSDSPELVARVLLEGSGGPS
jgi:pimeloyl-ACP methyl ester carboxylesterase